MRGDGAQQVIPEIKSALTWGGVASATSTYPVGHSQPGDSLASDDPIEVSVLIPCLDEEESVGDCVEEARKALADMGIRGEVIVVDNGSSDGSVHAAESAGARLVFVEERGYGNAYRGGLRAAQGRYFVMGDADGTYDFNNLEAFVEPLRRTDAEMVVGSRIRGVIEQRAMPWLHRYVGAPLFSALILVFFNTRLSDVHCGMRSLSRAALDRIDVGSAGMEFASELIIEASRAGLRIEEVPINYRTRLGGEPKLRTWSDGWRHLRLILTKWMEWRKQDRRGHNAVIAGDASLQAERELAS